MSASRHRRPSPARRRLPCAWRPRGDDGAAIVEFAFVSVMLIALLMGIIQVGIYLHVRNVLAASAAEGARYAANANTSGDAGGAITRNLVARGLGGKVADTLHCIPGTATGARGEGQVTLSCSAHVPIFFGWFGDMPGPKVLAHSIKES